MGRDDDRERTRTRLGALTRPSSTAESGPPGAPDTAAPIREPVTEPRPGDRPDGDTDTIGWSEPGVAAADSPPGWLATPLPASRRLPAPRLLPERLRGARMGLSRGGIAALLLVGLTAAAGTGVFAMRERPVVHPVPPLSAGRVEPAALSGTTIPLPEIAPSVAPTAPGAPVVGLVVSVVGFVHASGLVRLPPGSRIADAIAAAGGAKEGADLLSLNMAARVADGDQILVGVADPNGGPPVLGSAAIGAGTAGGPHGRPGADAGSKPGGVDLNTATEAELDELPGVGPVTAAAIVAWRNANGPFTDVEQLAEVDGIGPARLAKLRDLVRV